MSKQAKILVFKQILKAKTARIPLYRQMERSFQAKRDKNMCKDIKIF